MIAGLDAVPLSRTLASLCGAMSVVERGAPPPMAVDRATIAAALLRFRAGFWQPQAQPLASLWSMYYFNALIIPAVTALLCCDRVLPVAIGSSGFDIDGKGIPDRLWISDDGHQAGDMHHRFDTLVHGHIEPFIALYAAETGVTTRVLWSNAATIIDYVVEAVASLALEGPRRDAEALLAGTGRTDSLRRLAQPLQMTEGGTRERKVCCTRYRLPNVAPCAVICPARDASMGMGGAGVRCRDGVGDE